jgi:mannose-6-phosphate isomerase-like protein (cupin superfamily)
MGVSMNTTTARAHAPVEILDPGRIEQLAWKAVPGCPGVRAAELRSAGEVHDALIAYQPGAGTPGQPHTGVSHHIWVVSGSATIAGGRVSAGFYVYVPAGTSHPVNEVGPEGCTLLQIIGVEPPNTRG